MAKVRGWERTIHVEQVSRYMDSLTVTEVLEYVARRVLAARKETPDAPAGKGET